MGRKILEIARHEDLVYEKHADRQKHRRIHQGLSR
jgi:hypothetical protein